MSFCENRKPEINYPCAWTYKVIGMDKAEIRAAIETLMERAGCSEFILSYSNASAAGKYHSWTLDAQVRNEEERNAFYVALKNDPAVKIVF